MTEILRLDHRVPAVAEQIVDGQRAGNRVEARLTGYDGMPGLHQDPAAVAALDLQVLGASTGNTPAISLSLQAGYVIVGRDDAGPVPVSHFARCRQNGDGTVG